MQLDKYQKAVVNADPQANLKVIGAPGSGKTGCLVSRYLHLYIDRGVKPSRILALTFSKKAASEIFKRIDIRVNINRQAKGNISTINAFCYRLYNDWRVGNKMEPLRVWQYGDKAINPNFIASDLMQKHLNSSDLSVFDAINRTLKSDPNPSSDLLEKIDLKGPVAKMAFSAWKEYELWMRDNNLTDFYGQVWNVDRLMHHNHIFASMVGQRFDKIICDEAQDMFEQTYRILLKLSEQSSIEFYGDPSQSIYGFNGAAPYLLDEIQDHVPDIASHHLANNYRSGTGIVEAVNDFGPSTITSFLPMSCVKKDVPGSITIAKASRISDQADYIAERIKENEYKYSDVYVLARTNGQCSAIYQRLLELGTPAYYAGNFSIWDKTHIKAAIGYAAITKGQDDPDDLLSILNVPSEDYVKAFGQSAGEYVPTRFLPKKVFSGKTFGDLVGGKLNISRGQRLGVSNIKKFIEHLKGIETDRGRVADMQAAISKWAQWSGLDYMSIEGDLSMVWDKLENLDYDVDKLKAYIQKMKETRRRVKEGMDKVQVMTIHQAKGLESLVIFLTGLSEPVAGQHRDAGFHPGRNTNKNINEENCLYYTGISRAIRHLYLTYYSKSGEADYELSSFVTKLVKEKANGQVQQR